MGRLVHQCGHLESYLAVYFVLPHGRSTDFTTAGKLFYGAGFERAMDARGLAHFFNNGYAASQQLVVKALLR